MVLADFWSRMSGGRGNEEPEEPPEAAGPPTPDSLRAALDSTAALVSGGDVPSPVTARVLRVVDTVRETLPRLDSLGAGSATAYNVMATATDYLPDAVNGYLRLPRRFADTRPVDRGRTSLMVLVDQLDLLGATMDRVFDAVYRDDAHALVAHGRFLADKFGRGSTGGDLSIRQGETALPAQPVLPDASGAREAAEAHPSALAPSPLSPPQPSASESAAALAAEGAQQAPSEPSAEFSAREDDPAPAAQPDERSEPEADERAEPPERLSAPDPLRPPSSLDL